ncbi:MAG: sirohydrochlorin cobaltochelatase [Desulfovibrio sp.]|nr:sirohydrochlorin cobaltochelatase [Desulfovibrio sp.]
MNRNNLFRLLPALLLLLALACAAGCAGRHASASAGQQDEGVLLVAFGTSVPEAMPAMEAVDRDFRKAFPDAKILWAYTSQIIRKKLADQGKKTGGISEGLARLAKDGVKVVRVQSLHVMPGEEFSALERAVLLDIKAHPGRFDAVYLGRPLLESRADAEAVASAVLKDAGGVRGKRDAVVLMAHGQEHGRAGLVFEGVRRVFTEKDGRVFMATVEGERGIGDLLAELKARKVQNVRLQPLMLVAGDHARNDLGGDEDDSWASQCRKNGMRTTVSLKGLGEVPGVNDVWIRHARESRDDLTKEPKKK